MNHFETIEQKSQYTNIDGKENVESSFYKINNDKTQIEKNVNGTKLSMTFNTGDILDMMKGKNEQVCLHKLLTNLKHSDQDSDQDSDEDSDDEILYKEPVKKVKRKLPAKYNGKTKRNKGNKLDDKQTKKNRLVQKNKKLQLKLKPVKQKRIIKIKSAKKDKKDNIL
tara:strand:+ start:40 stop:540 length:501 start_codon:yes stop_codon:yes gene_type:complete